MFVLDASVIAKWFKLEGGRDKALKIRRNYIKGKCDIIVPDFLLIEISNLLRYSKVFTIEDTNQALASLRELEITVIVPTFEIIGGAVKLSFKYDITVYDAIYLATAESIGYRFITADERLYRKTRKLGFIELLERP